jgi:alcohol dehydrogenase class IV
MAYADPSTNGNPKKLTVADMKTLYQHSITGELF